MQGLNEIYIQDPRARGLESEFNSYVYDPSKYHVKAITECDKFHIPNALLMPEQ